MGVVLYNDGYQLIKRFILLQLIQILTPGSNLIHFNEHQKEVGVRTYTLKIEEKHMKSLYCLININTERK